MTDPSRSMEFKAIRVVGCFLYTSGLPFTALLAHLGLPKLKLLDCNSDPNSLIFSVRAFTFGL